MTDICFMFEVHQPLRLNRNFHLDLLTRPPTSKQDISGLYFDYVLNKHIFDRVARKCYFPANNIILNEIDRFKRERKQFKVSYGISGVFIEQCERWNPDLLESFKQLAETGCVEFLEETYYHSLASLYGADQTEFVEQVKMHRQLMKDLFGYEPKVFENTECLYNNNIARTVADLGYKAVITEGTERVLGWRSPNFVYKAKGSSIPVLLRNYHLSDDIGFR
ncbi:MAG: glycoside hydrolase family 57 protein, partial [Candidatus Bathyarchaeota archaeon]|nr:glycoside hydrolase family 57 protein [Candidatus Bathyarchaeota archaeon]